jgi:pSer/pThr/pTyr-binding forkhead associated (FHA) protein
MEVLLSYQSSEGSREVPLKDGSLSFGRGSDANIQLDDSGLSRLNSTVFRDGDRIWILDENSTNGTFVNGSKVSPNGAILKNGDVIKIGNSAEIRVVFPKPTSTPVKQIVPKTQSATATASNSSYVLPILVVMFAVFVISVSALVIGVKVYGSRTPEIVQSDEEFPEPASKSFREDEDPKETPTPKQTPKSNSNQTTNQTLTEANNTLSNSPIASKTDTLPTLTSGKKYQEMSETEKRQFIKVRAEKVARMIGNQNGNAITEPAITIIKRFLDGYAQKIRSSRKNDCSAKGWLSNDMVSILERASKNAPFIIHAF